MSRFENAEILSPMVRASTLPLRLLALNYGADIVFTEELIDRSLIATARVINTELNTVDYVRKDKNQQQQAQLDEGSSTNSSSANNTPNPNPNPNSNSNSNPQKPTKNKSKKAKQQPVILSTSPFHEQNNLILQIGTSNSTYALQAANQITPAHIIGVDVNMGCPKNFSVQDNMGAALLKDVKTATDIVKTLKQNVDPNLSVTAKIRLIIDESDPTNLTLTSKRTIDFAKALEHAGADALTIHARTVNDTEQDSASWSELAPIVDSLNIPVVGNGDVWCREDMKAMKTVGKVKGVMLARGALYNLSVFRKSGGLLPQERVVQDYINLCCDYRNHVANTKYVVCEMITNRRTPLALKKQYKYEFPKNQGVKEVCGVKSLEQMCKLWDINRGTTASGGSSSSTVDVGNGRKYSDNYFLENNNETPIKKQKL